MLLSSLEKIGRVFLGIVVATIAFIIVFMASEVRAQGCTGSARGWAPVRNTVFTASGTLRHWGERFRSRGHRLGGCNGTAIQSFGCTGSTAVQSIIVAPSVQSVAPAWVAPSAPAPSSCPNGVCPVPSNQTRTEASMNKVMEVYRARMYARDDSDKLVLADW